MALLAFLALAHAEDPAFVGTEKPGQKFEKPEAHLAAELGGALTTGNTETWAVHATLDGSYRAGRNRFTLLGGANLGQSTVDANADGHLDDAERATGYVETARKYFADARYDRFVGDRDSLYLLAGVLVDPFAGYDTRSHAQLGYSRILVEAERTKLVAEIGADVAREDFVLGVDPDLAYVIAARGLMALEHKFNDNVAFTERVEVYEAVPAFSDVRVLNQAGITAKLDAVFSVKVQHQLTFDNVPVEGFEKLDQTSTVTFVATLL